MVLILFLNWIRFFYLSLQNSKWYNNIIWIDIYNGTWSYLWIIIILSSIIVPKKYLRLRAQNLYMFCFTQFQRYNKALWKFLAWFVIFPSFPNILFLFSSFSLFSLVIKICFFLSFLDYIRWEMATLSNDIKKFYLRWKLCQEALSSYQSFKFDELSVS